MSVAVEIARQQWEEGYRRLEAEARDGRRYRALLGRVEAVTEELGRRVGQTFTLAELAGVYERAERWSRDVVAAASAGDAGWARDVAAVEDAAFHVYARGAIDYAP